MRIEKVLDTVIDISDPQEIYSADIKSIVLRKLKDRYVNKCFASIYILDVIEIMNMSPIMILTSRLDADGQVNVQFKVDGFVFIKGELIPDCKVIDINVTSIIMENNYMAVFVRRDPKNNITNILSTGDLMPICIESVRYSLNKDKISAIGTPFVPRPDPDYYMNIIGKMNDDEKEKIESIYKVVNDEERKHEDLKKRNEYKFFIDILYPYKNKQQFKLSPIYKKYAFHEEKLDIDTIKNIKDGCVLYTHKESRHNKVIFVASKAIDHADISAINTSAYSAFSTIYSRYLVFLQTLRKLVETYSIKTDADLKYWKLCTVQKV
jgi:hypothetical protein